MYKVQRDILSKIRRMKTKKMILDKIFIKYYNTNNN